MTEVCSTQKAEMIARLRAEGLDAVAVVVGDDPEHESIARRFGFEWVEHDNRGLGRKWNAGYARARALGCTHVMALGSDSFLDPAMILDVTLHDDALTAIAALSSFKPDGTERLDLSVRYAAGFGVAMIYPFALLGPEPADPSPDKMKGIDGSTWRRCKEFIGRQPTVHFEPERILTYTNFTSEEEQVTPWKALDVHRRRSLCERRPEHVFGDLRRVYPDSIVDLIERFYAARALGLFLQGRSAKESEYDRREAILRRQAARMAARGQRSRANTGMMTVGPDMRPVPPGSGRR